MNANSLTIIIYTQPQEINQHTRHETQITYIPVIFTQTTVTAAFLETNITCITSTSDKTQRIIQ